MTVITAEMAPLTDSTALIGDRAALDQAMDRDGYWFFRGVLDQEAIAEARAFFLAELEGRGLIEPGDPEAHWNGKPIGDFPVKIEPLHEARVWRRFVAHPKIHDFFTRLMGVAPFWVPSVEYRITPPLESEPDDELTGRHQDGFANRGMNLLACWVPLNHIGAEVGGLTMAAGMHKQGFFHDVNDAPKFRVPRNAIADDVWHRSDYAPGDLVMFGPMIPHSGMVNRSKRFRMSLDVRMMPIDSPDLPLVGNLLEIGPGHIRVANHDGRDVHLVLDEDTYCRGQSGARIPLPDMVQMMKVGDPVLVPHENGRAILFRPQR